MFLIIEQSIFIVQVIKSVFWHFTRKQWVVEVWVFSKFWFTPRLLNVNNLYRLKTTLRSSLLLEKLFMINNMGVKKSHQEQTLLIALELSTFKNLTQSQEQYGLSQKFKECVHSENARLLASRAVDSVGRCS